MTTQQADQPPSSIRHIRSFVRRGGRTTAGQRRTLEHLLPRYGLTPDRRLDPAGVFGRTAPLTLEIGFGNGDTLVEMAAANPRRDHIGIEVYDTGVARVLEAVEARHIRNLRVIQADAMPVLSTCLPPCSTERLLLLFPDPWPKKRHHKRRIVQARFVELAYRVLAPGGSFRLATDWAPYAEHMLDVIEAHPGFRNLHGSRGHAPRGLDRGRTRFEIRGERLGHEVVDLAFRRVDAATTARCEAGTLDHD